MSKPQKRDPKYKEPAPYRTVWQLTYDILELYDEILEDKEKRNYAVNMHRLQKLEKELNARDGLHT